MNLGKKKKEEIASGLSTPAINESKRSGVIVLLIVITMALIGWVLWMGHKAQDTITVAVLAQNVYKNQVITAEMLEPYEMIKAEYEKLYEVDENGNKARRILTWDEADMVINSFAAYPLQQGTYAEYRSFIQSRVDNSDSVLYSFPGKEIVSFDIGTGDLGTFKTFLQPGDKVNIQAIFKDSQNDSDMEIIRTETAFTDVMIADLLNSSGESILDIYTEYKDLTVWQQANLDDSSSFKADTSPSSLLVALTPEELERYYYYVSKDGLEFRMTLPQRTE